MNFYRLYSLLLESDFSDLPSRPPYGFWISPGGSYFPVRYQGHAESALKIINNNRELSEEFYTPQRMEYKLGNNDMLEGDALTFLMKAGYNRVVIEGQTFYYMKPSPMYDFVRITNSQMRTFRDLVSFYNLELER